MINHYCRCPGCGECAAHAREREHKTEHAKARIEALERALREIANGTPFDTSAAYMHRIARAALAASTAGAEKEKG